ncbi:hypothetical protein F4808DRAFT_412507 [Astrocystis sublimbata]|nr:hypothetical protein F4808DRAFT_412507 [Astrocystis sublimbata]
MCSTTAQVPYSTSELSLHSGCYLVHPIDAHRWVEPIRQFGSSYNASKAALHYWGNTLRVEMKPFGVRVMNIISGEVATNILKSGVKHNRKLPLDSVYHPIADVFDNHAHRTQAL